MAESYVRVPEDSIGKKLRTAERIVGANVVHEELIQVVNPADGVAIDPRDSFSDADNVAKKALVDADRHPQVDVLSSALPTGAPTEATIIQIRDYLDAVETKLQSLITLGADGKDATLVQIRDYLDTVETKLQSIIDNTDELEARIGEISATPTVNTLQERLKNIKTDLASLVAKDYATQTTLASILTELQQKTEPTDTQPVSAISLPLPVGASTEAKQDTGNTSLNNIDTKVGEVSATPTANTVLARLKDLLTGIVLAAGSNVIGAVTQSGNWIIQSITNALPAGTNIIGAVKTDIVNYTTVRKYVALTGTAETAVWTPTAGKKFVITDIHISADAAGTCTLRDGTAGTTFMTFSFAANGGCVSNLRTPIESAAVDNVLTAQASAITQYILVTGYEI